MTRREDLDGATMAARNAAIRTRATREELPVTKKIARQEKNLPWKKSVGPKFPQCQSENAKPLEIMPFYPCHFYLELCKLHQYKN